jgi:hypothetical protein
MIYFKRYRRNIYYFFYRKIKAWRLIYRNPIWGYQRIKRGYSEYDTYSFDTFLAPIIVGGAKRIKERALSHPAEITKEEWNIILDKIILAFEKASWPQDINIREDPEWKEGSELFIKWFFALWD